MSQILISTHTRSELGIRPAIEPDEAIEPSAYQPAAADRGRASRAQDREVEGDGDTSWLLSSRKRLVLPGVWHWCVREGCDNKTMGLLCPPCEREYELVEDQSA